MGTSGSGKSTFARRLGVRIGAPVVELDAINWQAAWRDLNSDDPPEFARRVAAAVAGAAWVSDGNYGKVRDIVLARATDVVWLDYNRALVMRRVIVRSFIRAISKRELWPGTGNVETFARWLDEDHPIRWAWDTHDRRRARYEELFNAPDLAHVRKHRLRDPRQADALVDRWVTWGEGREPCR